MILIKANFKCFKIYKKLFNYYINKNNKKKLNKNPKKKPN